jgi:hypothetical protein
MIFHEMEELGLTKFWGWVPGKWAHVKETTEIAEGKLFSPGNLRATFDNPQYEKVGTLHVS